MLDVIERRMTHLQWLEAEAIHIIREVAAAFDNPCMFYSIGKDSTVMLHLARKAFYPGRVPFPLLHIDTTWEFAEMARFNYGSTVILLFPKGAVELDAFEHQAPTVLGRRMGRVIQ